MRNRVHVSLVHTAFDRMEFARTPAACRALERFCVIRRFVFACVVLSAAVAAHAARGTGGLPAAVSLVGMALAGLIELLARAELRDVLALEAQSLGVSEGTARHYARAFLGRILAEHRST